MGLYVDLYKKLHSLKLAAINSMQFLYMELRNYARFYVWACFDNYVNALRLLQQTLGKFSENLSLSVFLCLSINSILVATQHTFTSKFQENEKSTPLKKNSFYFSKWNFLVLISKISRNRNPKKACYISANGTFQSTPRKFLILQETKAPRKRVIFSQKKAFLISQERKTSKKFFIYQETELSYISLETLKNFSKLKCINNFLYFRR